MKKIILLLISLAVIFSACSEQAQDSKNESQSKSPLENIDMSQYDSVKTWGPVYVLSKTDGTHEYCISKDNLNVIEEVPNTEFWLLSKNGEFLNDEPFYDYIIYEKDDVDWGALAVRYGVRYQYFVDGETGDITNIEYTMPDEYTAFGYTVNNYCWITNQCLHGVIAPDGSVFAEPIYYKVQIPFEDRIVLTNGDGQIFGNSITYIMTPEKEVISSEYNCVWYNVFDDGTYVGLALCGGYNETDEYRQLYDKNGEPMTDGYRFIDKDGNELSPCYKRLSVNGEEDYTIESPDDIITAIDENGNTVEFTAREYLCKE